jgi:drug/metabolite transporter (DMT)-like permease
MKSSRIDGVAALVLVVCWSSGFVGATLGTRAAPVDTELAWRTLVSALVLGCWALLRRERVRPAAVVRQAVLGMLVQVIYLGGVFAAAAAGVAAGTSALIAALQPLLVAALAGPVLGERTTRRQQRGLLIGAVGVALVVGGDLNSGTAAAWAYLLPVGALVALAAGTILERRWSPAQSLVTSLALQSTVAAVVFCLAAAVRGHLDPPRSTAFWLATTWLVVLSCLGGYGAYLFVVRRSGATRASTLLYLTPPTTAVWAWLLFGQAPRVLALPGVLICAAGVALAVSRHGPATPPRADDQVCVRDDRFELAEPVIANTNLIDSAATEAAG